MDHEKIYDDIRPFSSEEVPVAIERLLNDEGFREAFEKLVPEKQERVMITHILNGCKSVTEIKERISSRVIREIADKTTFSLSLSGKRKLNPKGAYMYMSNHRDIVLDSGFLNYTLFEAGFNMPRVAMGDNLLAFPWIDTLVRLNGSIIVKRGLSFRETLAEAMRLSAYLKKSIQEEKQSVWLAQREGRAKTSEDRTQISVLKMLLMSGEDPLEDKIRMFNIVPFTISYEFDPCDYLKAKELLLRRSIEKYRKAEGEDVISMKTGIMGYKGRVHLAVGTPLNDLLENIPDGLDKISWFNAIAELIDREIFKNYRFYPGNYIAYDELTGMKRFSSHYSKADRLEFNLYIQKQLDKIVMSNKDEDFLRQKMLEMYSNPLKNHLVVVEKDERSI